MNFKSTNLQDIFIIILLVAILSIFAIDFAQTKAKNKNSTDLVLKEPIIDKNISISSPVTDVTSKVEIEEDTLTDESIDSPPVYDEYYDYSNDIWSDIYDESTTSPEEPNIPDVPSTPNSPIIPEKPVLPEVPSEPEKPINPDPPASENPDVPIEPDKPEVPEVPEQPEVPEVPEQPEQPEKPEVPEHPTEPEEPISYHPQIVR